MHTKIEHQRIASFHYIIRSTMATRAASAARWCRRRRCPLDAHRVGRPHLVGAAIHRLYSYSCPGVYNAVKLVVQAAIAIAKSVVKSAHQQEQVITKNILSISPKWRASDCVQFLLLGAPTNSKSSPRVSDHQDHLSAVKHQE